MLEDQSRAIDALIAELLPLDPDGEDVLVRVPLLMLQAVGVSLRSVLRLTEMRDMSIRDCFGIARSAVETAVNASFIAVSGREMAEKAIRHMRQKRWRDLNREGRIGESRVRVSRDIGSSAEQFEGLPEALAEYTSKRGDEVRDWTSENLEKRIAAISDRHSRGGLCLGTAVFAVYRPASELLHGTYYGVNLFWQGSRDTPANGPEEFDELWLTEHFVTLHTALFFGVSGAVDVIASVNNLKGHDTQQNRLSRELASLVDEMSQAEELSDHRFGIDPRN